MAERTRQRLANDYSYEIVRYACQYLGDAYAALFDPDHPDRGRPQYKAKYDIQPAFTIPFDIRIKDGILYLPKRGWTLLGPIRRYANGQPLTVRVKQEAEGRQPKWYAYMMFEVPVDHPDVCGPRRKEPWALTATWARPRTAPEPYTPSPT